MKGNGFVVPKLGRVYAGLIILARQRPFCSAVSLHHSVGFRTVIWFGGIF